MTDNKAVRRYQAGIERALGLFDATNEWADYIAFLSRLHKSLQDPPPGADIAYKSIIARHLAQCLRPSLPSGVHQKALEVYELIFSIIGIDGLASDLALYLPGVSHTLSFASLSTRPQFLAIYDNHILRLPINVLRPALRALIVALLPGIEEETSEDFERTLSTFNRLRSKFLDDGYEEIFWQNLFLASITNANRRAGVLVYLTRYLPKLIPQSTFKSAEVREQAVTKAMEAVTEPEPGLLVRCFATGLQDPQPLVQRGFLDLLVSHLPLDAYIFANRSHLADLDILVSASTAVVLRRDMSLNRRLWAWYTGSDIKQSSSNHDAEVADTPISPTMPRESATFARYFSTYGLSSLTRSLSTMLADTSQEPSRRARPFRTALSLMDRGEIGGPVVNSLFVSLVRSLQLYQASAPSQEAFDEVFRSANTFFDGIESRLVAAQLLRLLNTDDLDLVAFIVNNFNLDEDEMTRNHIPAICLYIVQDIRAKLQNAKDLKPYEVISKCTSLGNILEDLIRMMPIGLFNESVETTSYTIEERHEIMKSYSDVLTKKNLIKTPTSDRINLSLVQGTFECLYECLQDGIVETEFISSIFNVMRHCIVLLDSVQSLAKIQFLPRLLYCISTPGTKTKSRSFQAAVGIARLITAFASSQSASNISRLDELHTMIPMLVKQLWQFLLSSTPQFHVDVVESIWNLHGLSKSLRLVESTIMSLLVDASVSEELEDQPMQCFSTLWIHSRSASKLVQSNIQSRSAYGDEILDLLQLPLLQIIDSIDITAMFDSRSQWIKSLNSLNSLFSVVFISIPNDTGDLQNISMSLQRLTKLIMLAKANDAQWKSFCSKTGHRDAVLELCSSVLLREDTANTLGVESLKITRLLLSNDGIEIGDEVLKMLSSRLVASYALPNFQNAILDTLQVALTTSNTVSDPEYLIPILLGGMSADVVDLSLDKWITLLCSVIPLFSTLTLLSNLLKITSCLCKRIESYFSHVQNLYSDEDEPLANGSKAHRPSAIHPERSISNLLAGMEYVLARAHQEASSFKPDQVVGPNGSTTDLTTSRSFANYRLTVVLCMQDALKVCTKLWLWRSAGRPTNNIVDVKSLQYLSLRLRTRSRRILENLVEAEPQECLESLMGLWVERRTSNVQQNYVLELLQTLDGARPKFMMPATFNAIYSRTNPAALDQSQKSSMSVDMTASELIAFLNDYTGALEDDLLEEIWTDCTTFLKEVLANPMPHRQILFGLLDFTAVLCRKMENTNFGEESRMRKELAELCARLFTAIFTIKPAGFDGSNVKGLDVDSVFMKTKAASRQLSQPANPLQILHSTLPDLAFVLAQSDRLLAVYNGIAANITGPALHSKLYPQNISAELLALLQTISAAPAATKAWKRDVLDAFNDSRFFQNQAILIELAWLPLIKQLAIVDKTIMPELLARLTPPAAAGLMFGVGASAARSEADRKTQLNLKRIATMLLSLDADSFLPQLQLLLAKAEELIQATPESSPSSVTKADIFMLLRTLLLTFSQSHLSAFWPLVENELRDLCNSIMKRDLARYTLSAQMQGAKLLDMLLLLKPDEFQVHEWLFVTDTVDAIYPPHDLRSVALADQIVHTPLTSHTETISSATGTFKRPWLSTDDSRHNEKIEGLLSGFFAHLSIRTFEDNYGLKQVDLKLCREDLIKDLFND